MSDTGTQANQGEVRGGEGEQCEGWGIVQPRMEDFWETSMKSERLQVHTNGLQSYAGFTGSMKNVRWCKLERCRASYSSVTEQCTGAYGISWSPG